MSNNRRVLAALEPALRTHVQLSPGEKYTNNNSELKLHPTVNISWCIGNLIYVQPWQPHTENIFLGEDPKHEQVNYVIGRREELEKEQ